MSENKHLTPVWIAYVDGKRLDTGHEGALKRIVVRDRLNGPSTFSMLFDTTAVKIRDKKMISLESQISIHLGYKDDVDEVFDGEVLGFRAILPEYGVEQLEVYGSCALHRLDHGPHWRSYEEKKPDEIAKALIDGYSLKSKIDTFGTAKPFASQQGQSDWEYLACLAEAHGLDVYCYGDTVYVGKNVAAKSDEVIFEWGKSLVSFEGEEDLRSLVSGATVIGWDPQKNESFSSTAKVADSAVKVGGSKDWTKVSKGGGGMWEAAFVDHAAADADEAKALAAGYLQKNSMRFSRARGTGEGNYKLKAGMRVTVKMVGEAFSGEYVADAVTHVFDWRKGYQTEFSLKRNMSPC